MKSRPIKILSLAHMITDLNQGALPAMLPFFIAAYDLSYTAAGAIVFAVNMTSSIVQPLFGYLADKSTKPRFLPFSVALAGIGLGISGYIGNYWLILMCAMISGVGVAAFHPEGARLINKAAGGQKSTAMSIFGVGGTIGFALGPIVMGFSLQQFGLAGSAILIVPVLCMAGYLAYLLPEFTTLSNGDKARGGKRSQIVDDDWPSFVKIGCIVSTRSIFFFGLTVFIPLYWIKVLLVSEIHASIALSVFSISGIIGNLIGGKVADTYGRKRVMLVTMTCITFILPLFLFTANPFLALGIVALVSILFFAGYSPTITLGQAYLPNRIGLSSGVTLGLAVAVGGGASPFIGKVADLYGIAMAMKLIAWLPILPLLMTCALPDIDRKNVLKPQHVDK